MVKDAKGLIKYVNNWVIRQALMTKKTRVIFGDAGFEETLLAAILKDSELEIHQVYEKDIDAIAVTLDALVLGTASKNDYYLTRTKGKRGNAIPDASPFALLYLSELNELAKELNLDHPMPVGANEYDLYEEEIENVVKLVERATGQLNAQAMMSLAAVLDGYIHPRQREVMLKLAQIENATAIRYNPNLPVCDVRDPGMGLVE